MVDLIQKKYAERITLASSSRASAHVAGRGKESSDIANAYTGTFDSTTCFINVATRPNVHGRPSYVATPFVMIDQGIQPFAAASDQVEILGETEAEAVERAAIFLEHR